MKRGTRYLAVGSYEEDSRENWRLEILNLQV